MRKLFLPLLLLATYAANAQSFQLGLETGMISNYPDKGMPKDYFTYRADHPYWKQVHLNTGLFVRIQTNKHLSFEAQGSTYHDGFYNTANLNYDPSYNRPWIGSQPQNIEYIAQLDCNIFNLGVSAQYCLNTQAAISKDKPLKFFVGASYSWLINVATYHVTALNTTANDVEETNSKRKILINTIGFHYVTTYNVSKRFALSCDLSIEKSTEVFNPNVPQTTANFSPDSLSSYTYYSPIYYLRCLFGVAYRF